MQLNIIRRIFQIRLRKCFRIRVARQLVELYKKLYLNTRKRKEKYEEINIFSIISSMIGASVISISIGAFQLSLFRE